MATRINPQTFSVNKFISNMNTNGLGMARANQFTVVFNANPVGVTARTGSDLLVKAGQFPGSTVAPLPVNFGGRIIKLTGFRTFDNWTVTVINDEDFSHRKWFEAWMYTLAGTPAGARGGISTVNAAGTANNLYKNAITADIRGADNQGSISTAWRFYNLWPTALGEITVDWSSDAIEEYTVEFAYEYWSHGHQANSPMKTDGTTPMPAIEDVGSEVPA